MTLEESTGAHWPYTELPIPLLESLPRIGNINAIEAMSHIVKPTRVKIRALLEAVIYQDDK